MKLAPKLLFSRLNKLESSMSPILKNVGGSLEAWKATLDECVADGRMGKEDSSMLYGAVKKWVRDGL